MLLQVALDRYAAVRLAITLLIAIRFIKLANFAPDNSLISAFVNKSGHRTPLIRLAQALPP